MGIWEGLKGSRGREKWYSYTKISKKGVSQTLHLLQGSPPRLLHPHIESQYHSRIYQNLCHHITTHLIKYLLLCIYSTNSYWMSGKLQWAIWGHDSSLALDLNAALGRGSTYFTSLLQKKKKRQDGSLNLDSYERQNSLRAERESLSWQTFSPHGGLFKFLSLWRVFHGNSWVRNFFAMVKTQPPASMRHFSDITTAHNMVSRCFSLCAMLLWYKLAPINPGFPFPSTCMWDSL